MSWMAFLLILISAFLHAGWNFLSKSRRPSAAFYLLASLTSVVLWLPFMICCNADWGGLPLRFWLLALGSGCFEVLYFLGLFQAYRRSDISLAYPLARALPVLMVAGVTLIFGLGRPPGVVAVAGMVVVSLGCLLLPLKQVTDLRGWGSIDPAWLFILLAAAGTTGYTVIDSIATPIFATASASSPLVRAGAYLAMIEMMISCGLGIYVWRHRRERVEFRRLFLRSVYPSLCGLFASAAYALVLVAMRFVTNIGYLQAFRQLSLPLGVLAGIFILREDRNPVKLTGIGLILVGLVMVALN